MVRENNSRRINKYYHKHCLIKKNNIKISLNSKANKLTTKKFNPKGYSNTLETTSAQQTNI